MLGLQLVRDVTTKGDLPRLRAEELINAYLNEHGWYDKPGQIIISLRDFYESVFYPEFEFELVTDQALGTHKNEPVLGKTIFKERVVLVDKSISPPNSDARYSFTLAHEFGHAALHANRKRARSCLDGVLFRARSQDSLESQANRFAHNLLMPERLVKYKFWECYGPSHRLRYIGPTNYWFTSFGVSHKREARSYEEFCRCAAAPLTFIFGKVSKESLGLKLHNLGLVRDESSRVHKSEFD